MSKAADIGGKRLISLAPTPWVRWVTGDPAAEAVEVVGAEFQWVSRANDALIRVKSPAHGAFLVASEPLLAFFASFVLSTEIVRRVMR